MILYTRADTVVVHFPQDKVVEVAKSLLETVSSYKPNYFKASRDELQAKLAQSFGTLDRALQHHLAELNREEPLFGSSPVVEIRGTTREGINVEFTIGQKIVLAKLLDRNPVDVEAASRLIPEFKTMISNLTPSVKFTDVEAK